MINKYLTYIFIKSDFGKHLDEHLFDCRWKDFGCPKKERKGLISLHENDGCPFFLEFQKKQKESFFGNFLHSFKDLNNNNNKNNNK